MIDNSFNKKSFFKSKWLYIVSAICILAAGAGAFTASRYYNMGKNAGDKPETQDIDLNISYSETQIANRPVTNEPDTRKSTEKPTQSTTSFENNNTPYSGSFSLPMGTNIIKDYSDKKLKKNKTTDDWRVHSGIDFAGSSKSKIISIQSGRVTKVYKDPLWGNVAEINHGRGVVARYCGLCDKGIIKEGTQVKKAQVIGTLGEIPIEKEDGEHLHLEIYVNGKLEDPLKVMNKLGK